MPWSEKQHRYFEAIAHGMKPKGKKLSKEDAAKMAKEGISKTKKLYGKATG